MENSTVNAAARLDRLPISKWHCKFVALVVAGMFFDSVDLQVLGAVIGKLKVLGWATPEMFAKLVSVNFSGIFVGVIIAGFLVDRFGRRTLYMYNLIIYSVFTI